MNNNHHSMKFKKPLIHGRLVKRYKRFLADVLLDDGTLVTERGRKHLNTLIRVKRAGMRAVMLYVVQRMDVRIFSPARELK